MMLDAYYYCTTAGHRGAGHVTPLSPVDTLQYSSRACRGASSSRHCGRRESTIHHGVSRTHFLCHKIKLAPARGGTRTHTRTTRRKVNTRLRAVNGRPNIGAGRDDCAAAFAAVSF